MPYFSMAIRSMPMPQGKAGIFVGVEIAVAQNIGMHHAAAKDLEPIVSLADAQLVADALAADIHFHGWLGEGEVGGAESAS